MEHQQLLCDDVLYEVMKWMDGETLAVVGCVSTSLYRAAKEESLWEELCTRRWPSCKEQGARRVISELGGFKKLYSESSRLVSVLGDSTVPCVSPSSLVSLVDVEFRGESLLSRCVQGIPHSSCTEWFSSCPFRFDLESKQASESRVHHSRVWMDIYEGVKVSWIVINTDTGRIVNLSSRTAVHGQRHFPRDNNYVLRYSLVVSDGVECSIVLKCETEQSEENVKVSLRELSLQFKDVVSGKHLNGKESLVVLSHVLHKSRDRNGDLREYRRYVNLHKEDRAQDSRLDIFFLLTTVFTSLVFICRMF